MGGGWSEPVADYESDQQFVETMTMNQTMDSLPAWRTLFGSGLLGHSGFDHRRLAYASWELLHGSDGEELAISSRYIPEYGHKCTHISLDLVRKIAYPTLSYALRA